MIESLFPYVLKVHVTTVILLVGLIVWADILGTAWMRGKIDTIHPTKLKRIHTYMWVGLGTMLATGPILFYPYKEYLVTLTPFLIKMSFVAALIINGLFIGKLMHVATLRPFASLTAQEKIPLFVSGAISTISWIGAITAATMLNL